MDLKMYMCVWVVMGVWGEAGVGVKLPNPLLDAMCLAYQFEIEVGVTKKLNPGDKMQSQVKKLFAAAKVSAPAMNLP